jgi:hypothetical protein
MKLERFNKTFVDIRNLENGKSSNKLYYNPIKIFKNDKKNKKNDRIILTLPCASAAAEAVV